MPNADILRIELTGEEVRHLTAVGTVPGVIPLLAAARNGPGIGHLQTGDGVMLRWRAPGSATFGEPVACAPDGTFVLCDGEDADKWLRVAVHGEWIVAGSQEEVFLADRYNNAIAGDDVDAGEAAGGVIDQCQLALRNAADHPLWHLFIWMDTASDARVALSLDGVNWSAPRAEGEALQIAQIGVDESAALYVRRTVGPLSASTPKQRVHFHILFDRPL